MTAETGLQIEHQDKTRKNTHHLKIVCDLIDKKALKIW